jgi:hypothetical protein
LEKTINQGTEGKLKQEKTRYFCKIVVAASMLAFISVKFAGIEYGMP